ncbi:hypothetical protein N0V95_002244 [Ascochyta clinopodiicola]|nr:hypothetical protein N0V95_002244 [Ascochyta clinopodiicola]
MGNLRVVPSEGIRAENTSSSSKLGTISESTFSSSQTSTDPQTQNQTQREHRQSLHSALSRKPSSTKPFIATLEPIDTTPEERVRNILCQKVLMLAAKLFPKAGSSDDRQVEYVGEGSYHQVLGFSVPRLNTADCNLEDEGQSVIEPDKYVIRIPRDGTEMLREIAVLAGLEGQLNIPIPRVVSFDASKDNILGSQYTIETRLRGRSLEDLVSDDNFNE